MSDNKCDAKFEICGDCVTVLDCQLEKGHAGLHQNKYEDEGFEYDHHGNGPDYLLKRNVTVLWDDERKEEYHPVED